MKRGSFTGSFLHTSTFSSHLATHCPGNSRLLLLGSSSHSEGTQTTKPRLLEFVQLSRGLSFHQLLSVVSVLTSCAFKWTGQVDNWSIGGVCVLVRLGTALAQLLVSIPSGSTVESAQGILSLASIHLACVLWRMASPTLARFLSCTVHSLFALNSSSPAPLQEREHAATRSLRGSVSSSSLSRQPTTLAPSRSLAPLSLSLFPVGKLYSQASFNYPNFNKHTWLSICWQANVR